MPVVGYRWADYDTPLSASPNRSAGRWNRAGDEPTQYWALHPLGPWAEMARGLGMRADADLAEVRSRVWAAELDLEGAAVAEIGFAEAGRHGLRAEDLVGDDYGPCQDLAQRLRRQVAAAIVPSAALPGTSNLVLFGARVVSSYGIPAPDADVDVPAAIVADHGGPPLSLQRYICHRGAPHRGLLAWRAGGTAPPPPAAFGR